MERISEAGVLYLNDYQILTEARKEVERFLDAIVEEVYDMLVNEGENLYANQFKGNVWNNQSSPGHLQVEYKNLTEYNLFREGKSDLFIKYKDIRNADDIEPNSAKIYVWSPKVASKLESKLRVLSVKELGEDLYEPTIVEFDLNNSMVTAEKIVNEIINKNDMIEKLLESKNPGEASHE